MAKPIETTSIRMSDGSCKDITLNRSKAIKAKCTECMGWEGDPKQCTAIHCPLYPWRGRTLITRAGKDRRIEEVEEPEEEDY